MIITTTYLWSNKVQPSLAETSYEFQGPAPGPIFKMLTSVYHYFYLTHASLNFFSFVISKSIRGTYENEK